MGNCIRRRSTAEWGGEDWGAFTSDDKNRRNGGHLYHESSPDGETKGVLASSLPTGTQVKLKISKKQLEQILKKADVGGLSAEKVLVQLTHAAADRLEDHQPPWSPALQSIPE